MCGENCLLAALASPKFACSSLNSSFEGKCIKRSNASLKLHSEYFKTVL